MEFIAWYLFIGLFAVAIEELYTLIRHGRSSATSDAAGTVILGVVGYPFLIPVAIGLWIKGRFFS